MHVKEDDIMGKFDGMLICTDLDGTLYNDDKIISDENLNAIEYFKSEGGLFTFITGRHHIVSRDVYEEIKPNAPIGCLNGGGLYDYEKEKYFTCVDGNDPRRCHDIFLYIRRYQQYRR